MINENNYEIFFMSYIDNELNAAERAAVEAFILSDSKYAAELALFEKTKLQASSMEGIEMEDKIFLYRFPEMQASLETDFKKSLYKKEAPVHKIVFTPTILRASFAIAALLILFIGVQLFKTNTAIKDKTALAITNNASTNSKQPENTKLPHLSSQVAVNTNNSNTAMAIKAIPKNQNEFQNENQSTVAIANNTSNSININIISNSSSQAIRENDSQNILASKFNEGQITSNAMETIASEEDKIIPVIPTAYKEIDTEEEERTINIGMLEIDGATFRGITRRFSALLKRNKIEKEK